METFKQFTEVIMVDKFIEIMPIITWDIFKECVVFALLFKFINKRQGA